MKKNIFYILLLGILLLVVGGCGPKQPEVKNEGASGYVTIKDDNDRTVALMNKPERVVCLSSSFLGIIEAVDGKIIGRVSSKAGYIPEAMKDLPEVGAVTTVNMEKVIALKPDLVFALKGLHDKFIPLLESNNIKVIVLNVKTYQDVQEKAKLIADVYGKSEKGIKVAEELDKKVAAVAEKLPKEAKKIVILHASAKSVTVELDNSIAGCVANLLHFENVATGGVPLSGAPDKTPYSLEELVKRNPEIIFITSMGDAKDIENRLRADVQANPAWNSLRAVQENRIYFLPENLFLINPGINYPAAVEYMAKIVYPGVYVDGK